MCKQITYVKIELFKVELFNHLVVCKEIELMFNWIACDIEEFLESVNCMQKEWA